MTSEERRAARRRRREERREARRAKTQAACTIEAAADLDHVVAASKMAARGTRWKGSVQRYHFDTLGNSLKIRRKLLDGEDVHTGFHTFAVCERGKRREISAVRFAERVAQKAMNRHGLLPAVAGSLTADNAASLEGRGTAYAVRRLRGQLARHWRLHGDFGWVLLGDFRNYFGSIPHDGACELVRRHVSDPALAEAVCTQIGHQPGERGLTLGSELNQTIAVAYLSPVDHYAREMGGVEAYGRYMDDFYAISCDKARLWELLADIRRIAGGLGLELSEGKTRVVRLSRGFTFLKRRFSYSPTGHVVERPAREGAGRERRRLRRQARLVREGRMSREQAYQSYQSWRGHVLSMDARALVTRMDAEFRGLFGLGFRQGAPTGPMA